MSWCTKSSLWWTTSNCDEEGRKRNGRMRRESVWPCWNLEHFLPPLTQATAGWSRRPFSPDEGPGNGAAVGARPRSVYIALHVECPWYLFGHVDLSACLWVWSHCERILEFPQSYRVCVRAWNTHTHTQSQLCFLKSHSFPRLWDWTCWMAVRKVEALSVCVCPCSAICGH